MHRIFAHRILYQNREYRNHIAELLPDGTIRLTPFTHETPNTIFISGTIRLLPPTRENSRPDELQFRHCPYNEGGSPAEYSPAD